MSPGATDIALKYLMGLKDAVRKKNASKFSKQPPVEESMPGDMGGDELGEEDMAALLEGGELGEEDMAPEGMAAPEMPMEGDEEALLDKKKKLFPKG